MNDGIYSAPESDLAEAQIEPDYHLASTGQRFANLLIDSIGYLILSVVAGTIMGLAGLYGVIENLNDYVFGYILMSAYYLVQETLWGRTLGKLITKTKVQDMNGAKPSFLQILGRTMTRFVPFEAFSFLGGGGLPRGWHDAWSGTKVVSLKDIKN